jgi:predicted  nucleic acid-binding Zn-ribbon protein
MEGVTRQSLKPLLELQRIDSAVDRLNARRAHLPEQQELDELADRRAEVAALDAEEQAVLDTATREQNKLEAEVRQIADKIDHEQARLYSGEVNNAKELSAIQAELDALRRRKTHLEDQELDVMERREEVETRANDLSKQLGEADAQVADARARLDAASVEIARELAELSAERAQLVPAINAELVELYESMRPKHGGIAVAKYDQGTCRACGLPLSPLARDEIKRTDEALLRCENCRRLLVVV